MKTFLFVLLLILLTWSAEAATTNAVPTTGEASFYGDECKGLPMANQKPFNPEAMTCASWFVKLGTKLKVTNVATGASVIVECTDRGPAKRLVKNGRIIDLSRESFRMLEKNLGKGLIQVNVQILAAK
jgi:rare lipoprotein A